MLPICFDSCILKKKKYILVMFENLTQIVKKSYSNDSKWRRMPLSCSKKLSAILRAVTPKHQDDFRCLNSFHSFATKNKRDVMPSEDNKILEFNHY